MILCLILLRPRADDGTASRHGFGLVTTKIMNSNSKIIMKQQTAYDLLSVNNER